MFQLVSVAEETCSSLALLETPKTGLVLWQRGPNGGSGEILDDRTIISRPIQEGWLVGCIGSALDSAVVLVYDWNAVKRRSWCGECRVHCNS